MRFISRLSPGSVAPARLIAILGIFLVALILLGVASLTTTNLEKTSQGLDGLARSTQVGDAYSQTTIAIALASIHADEFKRTGDPDHRDQMLAQVREAIRQEALVKALGTDADRALLASLEQRYSEQLTATMKMPNGANIAEAQDANPLILDEIVQAFAQPTTDARDGASTDLESFQAGFERRSSAVLVAFLAALPVLGLLLFLILRYERKDAIRAEELRKLGQAVLTDGLTGLRNHRAFQEDLRSEVARASRTEQPVSVAMIDIDDFKEVNDTHGHARGDAVLTQMGKLMTFLRSEDRGYRLGGDEFALILPNTDVNGAFTALDQLRRSVTITIDGVTLSAGISSNHASEHSATVLRDRADMALYEAKHRGKNQVATYTDELDGGNEVTAAKMTALREVLRTGAVSMWFQPIFRLGSNQLLAFEALLRLPQTQEISGPEEAFEIAQRMGRSRDLDLLCASGALDEAARLPSNAKIFINIDPGTLMHSDFSPEELLALVLGHGIDPAKVVFEITEKTVAPLPRLAKQVDALQACGFGVALDDVGAGNSGLEMLRLMKFDYVKIDRSVVLDAMDGGPGRAVILAIVAFARETGAFMIAEGIENQEMVDSIKLDADGLRRFWVQGVQGFLFGEPRNSTADYTVTGMSAA